MSLVYYIAMTIMSLILLVRTIRGDNIPAELYLIPWMMFTCGRIESVKKDLSDLKWRKSDDEQ